MGKVIEPGYTGRVGLLVFYNLNGKNIVRSLPYKYKQTKATKASASEFGRASGIARSIRTQLGPVISNPTDNKMQTRLVTAVFAWIRSMRDPSKKIQGIVYPVRGFNFSEKSTAAISDRGFPAIQISSPSGGLVQIRIPAFIPKAVMKAPAYTESIHCRLCTCVTNIKNSHPLGSASVELEIEYNDTEVAAQTISFKLPTMENALVVTGASLIYRLNKSGNIQVNTNKAFMPEEILSAVCLLCLYAFHHGNAEELLFSLFGCFVNAAVYDGEVFSGQLGPPIFSHIVKGIFTVYDIIPIGAYIIVEIVKCI
jgi:hypothetical protein